MPLAIDPRTTFLRRHVRTQLAYSGDLLALGELRAALRDARPAVANLDAWLDARLTPTAFFTGYPDMPLYRPLRLVPADDAVRTALADADLVDLSALLTRLREAKCRVPGGVVLMTRSGAGKTVAARAAFRDCVVGGEQARLGGLLPCWLPPGPLQPWPDPKEACGPVFELIHQASEIGEGRIGLPEWLRVGPPLLLFVDLNAFMPEERQTLARSLVAYRQRFPTHLVVVAYRTPGTEASDNTLAQLLARRDAAPLFARYDLATIPAEMAVKYLEDVRRLEVVLRTESGLPVPNRDDVEDDVGWLRGLIRDHVRSQGAGGAAEGLVSTPLLMHFVTGLTLGRTGEEAGRPPGTEKPKRPETLKGLYEAVVRQHLTREVEHFANERQPLTESDLSVAMSRLALAMLHRGTTRLEPARVRELLAYPEESVGDGPDAWVPSGEFWRVTASPYYVREFPASNDPKVPGQLETVLRFALLRPDGVSVGFLHDSFLYYFAALAVRYSREPGIPTRLRGEWPAVAERMRERPDLRADVAAFLGGMVTATELAAWMREVIAVCVADGVTGLVLRAPAGREGRGQASDDVVLRGLERAVRKEAMALATLPEALASHCHGQMWHRGAEPGVCRQWAEELAGRLKRAGRGWLRAERGVDASNVMVLRGHTGAVKALAMMNDGRLVSAGNDGSIRVWDVDGNQPSRELGRHAERVFALCVLRDGRLVSASDDHRTVRIWDANGDRPPRVLGGHTGRVFALCVLRDGRLASARGDGTIRIWDVDSDQSPDELGRHANGVLSLCELTDGRLASAGYHGSIRVWDVNGNQPPRVLGKHTGKVFALCVLRDGRLVSANDDHLIRIWDVDSDRFPDVLGRHADEVDALCVLRDGQLVSASNDGTIRIWGVDSKQPSRVLGVHTDGVDALCVLADGRLVSGGRDDAIRIWDVDSDQPPRLLEGHAGWVRALCVLGDGRLVSGSRDCTIRLWNTTSGRCVTTTTARAAVICLVWHPIARRLIAGLADGRLLWLALEGDLLRDATP